jgi:type I site-specific restriction endonuclease
LIEERAVEIYNRLRDELRRDFERLVDEYLGRSNVDEKTVKSIARAVAGQEFARLHGIVREELDEFKAEVEERLSKYGIDAETIRRIVDEVYGKLLNDVKQLLDQRIMHVLDAINEQTNSVRDVLDLVNEIVKAEAEFEEKLSELRAEIRRLLDEEALEELLYRALVKHGVIRRKRRKWAPLIAGLGVLAAVIAGFIINPIATLVILFIAIVVLLRW